MPALGPCKCSLTRQFLLDDLVICKGVLFITEIYCNLLITRQFSAVYRLTQFIKVSINLTIYTRLPVLLNQNQIWTKGEKLRTFYNTDGLINWLRQPGQLRNQHSKSIRLNSFQLIKSCGTLTDPAAETKSIGLPADALVPCFLLAT